MSNYQPEVVEVPTYQDLPSAGNPSYMTGAPVEGTHVYVRSMGKTFERQGERWVEIE